MKFNSDVNGFQNEIDICKMLNNKCLKDLDPMYNAFITDLYGNLCSNDLIKCKIDHDLKKYDIVISVNDIKKYVSIKKGVKNSVHVEPVFKFTNYLRTNGVKWDIIEKYLRYHFADGTTNGKGINRISVSDYKLNHQEEIDMINSEINNDELLLKSIYRFVLLGNVSDRVIDAILFGVKDDFVWIKTQDIIDVILKKKDVYSTSVHFGPLTVQPMDRCLNHNPKLEKYRYFVQIKWYKLADDIIENMNNKCMNKID